MYTYPVFYSCWQTQVQGAWTMRSAHLMEIGSEVQGTFCLNLPHRRQNEDRHTCDKWSAHVRTICRLCVEAPGCLKHTKGWCALPMTAQHARFV